jgi:UDP-N-acetylmuramoyl-L-alanyl-D-glutamate--2,6-diaminopimelate ligase
MTVPEALQSLARPTPAPFDWAEPFFTLGVTGTNGKTSTTLLIAAALRGAGHKVLTETTLGYQLDDQLLEVPRTHAGYLSAFERAAGEGCRHASIELTSQALGAGYAKRWRFDLGVYTNLSRDHLEAHASWEHYLGSKAQLFVHLGPGRTAVLNACDEAAQLLDVATPADVERVWYAVPSRGPALHAADLVAKRVDLTVEGTRVELEPSPRAEALGGAVETRLVGEIFAENALAAAAAALAAGVSGEVVRRGIAGASGPAGRFEVVHRAPVIAIDYAHTPDALARTCDTARRLAGGGRVLVVFGAGGGFDPGKRGPMGQSVGSRADVAIVTTDNPRNENPREIARAVATGCRRGGRAYVRLEPDRRRAIAEALERARSGDVVVIAGKGHETGQRIGDRTIDLSDGDVVRELIGT